MFVDIEEIILKALLPETLKIAKAPLPGGVDKANIVSLFFIQREGVKPLGRTSLGNIF